MKLTTILGGGAALLALAALGIYVYAEWIANPAVVRALLEDPEGERAQRAMLLTLPSGRRLPVNYLEEDGRVYAGADGRWWRELEGEHAAVELLVKGRTHRGRAKAILDQPDYTKDVFSRLRPTAIPGFGTLIEILLDEADPGGPIGPRGDAG